MSTAERVLLLMPKATYRAADFLAAAERLGVEVAIGSDRCHVLDALGAVTLRQDSVVLDFRDVAASVERIAAFAREKPIAAVVSIDDPTVVLAARASEALALPRNPPEAAAAARDKKLLREKLAAGGVRQAAFVAIDANTPLARAAAIARAETGLPCVLKPRALSASRGVIRADDVPGFAAAWVRVVKILSDPAVRARSGDLAESVLVESYVPGAEVAVEGLLTGGELEVLAVFDKPDPLEGPYFEETIYVTPSRHPAALLAAIAEETQRAVRALGLVHGPIHAELRLPDSGPHVVEVAPRSIGGLCARTLRHGLGVALEELIILHALGRAPEVTKSMAASGVLMIPIPRSGVLRGVEGVSEARAVPGIQDIAITAPIGRDILALPEGDSYLGFAFARGETPAAVEAALRSAKAALRIEITASLPVVG